MVRRAFLIRTTTQSSEVTMSLRSFGASVRFRLPRMALAALLVGGCMDQDLTAPTDIGPPLQSHVIFGGLASNAYSGQGPAREAVFTPAVQGLPGGVMAGEVVHVGRGCTAGGGVAVDDPYLANPAGKIALIDRGVCLFDNKVARAQLAGAVGVIVFNVPGEETVLVMGGNNPVTGGAPTLIGTAINIPAIFIGHTNGVLLRDFAPPVTVVYTPPPPPTPAQLLDHVYEGLEQVLAAGDISAKDAKALRNSLDAVAKELAKGQNNSAMAKLDDFVRQVNSFEAKGALTAVSAAFLRSLAAQVMSAF
jgi:hypothetical protein